MILSALFLAQTVATVAVTAGTVGQTDSAVLAPTWTPHRVYDVGNKRWTGFEEMAAAISDADVIFFGEQHDDPGTHAMQRAILEAIGRRRSDVILSLEMFERDVQALLTGYLEGSIPEDTLLANGRPWPRYQTDYRAAVEWAKSEGWPVVAANVPRPIARAAAGSGMAALDSVPSSERGWFARELVCPLDDQYFEKFSETMAAHLPGDTQTEKDLNLERYYLAQCIKDETMAESIVRARAESGDRSLVVHFDGAFHSNYGLGTAERVVRRSPADKVIILTGIPVENLDAAAPSKDDRELGDWLVYTLKP